MTSLLVAWRGGDAAAVDRLLPLVCAELRRVAHRHMRDQAFVPAPERAADLLALDEALDRLAVLAPGKARVVELRQGGAP